MKKCEQCNKRFSYKETFRSIFNCYENITCKNCNAQYKATFPSIVIISILIVLPLLLKVISILVINNKTHLLYYAIYEVLIILLSPFLVVYKKI